VDNNQRRQDAFVVLELMKDVTGEQPRMWGDSIVGFGRYHYRYASGREGDMPIAAFSPRKQNLTLYIASDFDGYDELLGKLGKHSTSKACLYIKRMSDVDPAALRELVRQSVEHMRMTTAGSR
jgi:hypothetical protein